MNPGKIVAVDLNRRATERRRTLNRLYLIVGGARRHRAVRGADRPVVRQLGRLQGRISRRRPRRILGQPVHVNGSADASILPSPSLTFTDVEVGETEGQPMMTVKRFSVTIELMPLIQGEIRVVSMKLEKPVVARRGRRRRPGRLDDPRRGLARPRSRQGRLERRRDHRTARSSMTMREAVRPSGSPTSRRPSRRARWPGRGGSRAATRPTACRRSSRFPPAAATTDGSLRVKADVTPGQWPIAIGADGVLAQGEAGPTYTGTYNLTQVIPAATEGEEGRRRRHRLAERGQLQAHPRPARGRQGGALRRPAGPAVEPRRVDDARRSARPRASSPPSRPASSTSTARSARDRRSRSRWRPRPTSSSNGCVASPCRGSPAPCASTCPPSSSAVR